MGNQVTTCFGVSPTDQDPNLRKISYAFQIPNTKNVLSSTTKNDDEFYYIQREAQINNLCNQIDESKLDKINEDMTFEDAVGILVKQKEKLLKIDSLQELGAEPNKESVTWDNMRTAENSIVSKESKDINTNLSQSVQNKKLDKSQEIDIRAGKLVIEVQKAHFLYSKHLDANNLSEPSISVNVYLSKNVSSREVSLQNYEYQLIKSFHTHSSSDPVKIIWDEVLSYVINENKKLSRYWLGLTLLYKNSKDGTQVKIGEEQIFSMSAFLDQNVQIKLINLKDFELKGTIAKIQVRVQLIHTFHDLKEKLLKNIDHMLERLYMIKNKVDNGNEGLLEINPNLPADNSHSSSSSLYEEEKDTGYFIT